MKRLPTTATAKQGQLARTTNRRRNPPATRAPSVLSKEAHTRLGRELMGVCVNSLAGLGVEPSSALSKLPRVTRADYARRLLSDAGKTARVHTRWQQSAEYLDEYGHPKTIQVRGPAPSFQALCNDCGLIDRWESLLNNACHFGVCERMGRDRLAYVSDVVLLTGHQTLMLARAAVTVERLLRTCVHNAAPGRKHGDALGDVTTEVSLSDPEFARLSKATRRFLGSFIESTDRQLLTGVARDRRHKRPTKSMRRCGVTAFVFRD